MEAFGANSEDTGTKLPRNGNVRRDSADVSVWELVDKIDPQVLTESEKTL